MKEIFVSHSKDDKSFAKKLVSKLESKGYPCSILSRDKNKGSEEELISSCNIFIIILSKSTQQSQEMINQIKLAVENEMVIIPVKSGDLDKSLSMQYFLHSLEWVDAHGDGFDEAFEVLLEIIEEVSESKPVFKTPKKKPNSTGGKFKLSQSHYITIISVLAVIIIYLLFFQSENNSQTTNKNGSISSPEFVNSKLTDQEKIVVGSWKLVDYEDSRIMTAEEKAITAQNIENMKKRVLLTYNEDRTFERIGFAENVQRGYWEYDSNKRIIYLTPEGTHNKEEVNILTLDDKNMTIVVNELVQNVQGKTETVTTKISFQKQ